MSECPLGCIGTYRCIPAGFGIFILKIGEKSMRKSFRLLTEVAVVSVLTVSSAHADFLGTLNQTINKVQQTVDGTKQAVDSTTQAVNGAQQTVNATTNTVQQVQQIPQQAQQLPVQATQAAQQPYSQPYPPAQVNPGLNQPASQPQPQPQPQPQLQLQNQSLPPQNSSANYAQAMMTRETEVRQHMARALATQKSGYQQAQFQQKLMSVTDQGRTEIAQIAQRYSSQVQKDPNNQALRTQYEAEIQAAGFRNLDRMEQFCSDVETGRIRFEPNK